MLNELTHSSPFIRLSLCLALSSGLHAGAASLDWLSSPVKTPGGEAPVAVAFLPADESPTKSSIHLTEAEKSQPVKQQKNVKKKVVQESRVKPLVKPPVVSPPKKQKKVRLNAEAKKPSKNSVSADLVCVNPQKEKVGQSLDTLTVSNQVAVEHQKVITENPVEKADVSSDNNVAASEGGHREVLREAVPRYRINPKPEYPYVAAKRRWEGVVWLLVDVSSEGLVNNLQVERSCGYRVLDKAASKTVKRWEFVPAMRAGLPVASQVRIPVRFRLEDG